MVQGLRVVFSPNPASRALYSYCVPDAGARGTVTAAWTAGGLRTYLVGPWWWLRVCALGRGRPGLRRLHEGPQARAGGGPAAPLTAPAVSNLRRPPGGLSVLRDPPPSSRGPKGVIPCKD